MKPWRALGLAVSSLLVFVVGCPSHFVDKVEELVDLLRGGHYHAAYLCCTSQKFRAKVTPARFEEVLARFGLERATRHQVELQRHFAEDSSIAEARLETTAGTVRMTFYVYRPELGGGFLVGQILVGEERLFAEELGEW